MGARRSRDGIAPDLGDDRARADRTVTALVLRRQVGGLQLAAVV